MRNSAITDSDLAMFDGFIAAMADRASRLNRGSYNDFDDYMQIGRIAAWRASQEWSGRGSFPRYARMTIRYEIINAAIETKYIVSAPRRIKRDANRAQALLAAGHDADQIRGLLNLPEADLKPILHMVAPVCREGVWL